LWFKSLSFSIHASVDALFDEGGVEVDQKAKRIRRTQGKAKMLEVPKNPAQ
jgi:hypothetical protein